MRMSDNCYRLLRVDDGRCFSVVGRGFDAYGIMSDAIVKEFEHEFSPRLRADELSFVEEYDEKTGEWTGYDIACAFGQKLARIELP